MNSNDALSKSLEDVAGEQDSSREKSRLFENRSGSVGKGKLVSNFLLSRSQTTGDVVNSNNDRSSVSPDNTIVNGGKNRLSFKLVRQQVKVSVCCLNLFNVSFLGECQMMNK